MAQATYDITVRAQAVGLQRVSREINNLYRTNVRSVAEMNSTMQQFGHHSFKALTIFRGLALYRGFGVLTQNLAEGAQKAIEFQKEMANVNSLLLESDQGLRQYGEFAYELGQKVPIALGDIARGLYDIASAGFTAREEIEAIANLAGKAATAGVTDLKNAVQAGVGTMNAFGKSVNDLEHIYDVHFMTVKQGILTYEQLNQVMGRVTATASLAGQGMETAFAALVAVSRGGFGGAAFAEGSTRVVRFFQELSDPAAQRDIEKLGVAVFDSFGKMRNAIDIVADINKVLADSTEEARQAQIRQIFTNIRSAQGFEVLSKQLDIWREAQMKNIFSAGAMENAFEKQIRTISASLLKIQNQFTQTMSGVIEYLAPIADMMTKTMEPLVGIIGILLVKYVALGIQARVLAEIEKQHAIVLEQKKVQIDLYNLATERRIMMTKALMMVQAGNRDLTKQGIFIDQQKMQVNHKYVSDLQNRIVKEMEKIVVEKKGTIQTRESTLSVLENIRAQLQKISVNAADIGSTLDLIHVKEKLNETLWLNRVAYGASIASMAGMIGMMIAMNTGSGKLTKTIMATTMGITTFSMLIQMLTPFVGKLTKMLSDLTITVWGHTIAISAERAAMLGIVAVAGSVAIAVALMISTYSQLDKISASTAVSLDDLEQGIYDVGGASEDTTAEVGNFIKELVRAGATIDEVERKISNLYGAYDKFGKGAALGLAKSGYANIGGTELMQVPTWAFPKLTEEKNTFKKAIEGTDFESAMNSIYFKFEQMKELWEGSPQAFLDVQKILLDMSDETMRNTFATMIFGDKFGQSLIALWDDAGKKAAYLSGRAVEAADAARQGMEDIEATIRSSLEGAQQITTRPVGDQEIQILKRALEEAGFKEGAFLQRTDLGLRQTATVTREMYDEIVRQLKLPDASQDIIQAAAMFYTGREAEFKEITDEYHTYLVNAMALQDDQYNAFLQVADRGMLTFTSMLETATEFEKAVAKLNLLSGAIEQAKDIMKIGSAIEAMAERGQELDSAGFHFDRVAGRWDDLGREWKRIQTLWESINMVNTFLDVFNTIQELEIPDIDISGLEQAAKEGLENMAPALEPLVSQWSGMMGSLLQSLSSNLGDPDFWRIALQSDEIIEAVEEGMKDLIDAVSGLSKLDDFVQSIVDAGIRLDEAGYHFGNVAGQWSRLGEQWAEIQKVWLGLEMMGTLLEVVNNLDTAVNQMVQVGTEQVEYWTGKYVQQTRQVTEQEPVYGDVYTAEAKRVQLSLKSMGSTMWQLFQKYVEYGNQLPDSIWQLVGLLTDHPIEYMKTLFARASDMEQAIVGYSDVIKNVTDWVKEYATREQPMYDFVGSPEQRAELANIREALIAALTPIISGLAGEALEGFIEIMEVLLGPIADQGFWEELLAGAAGAGKTIEEMANEFIDMLQNASGIGSAIEAMVEHSAVLEEAGYYWKGVAGNWENLGAEWGRIQSYFKVTEFINSFIQSARAMEEFGVTLPSMFQESMFTIMQNVASFVLPDFQNVINGLLNNIQSENFWSALADGMAAADITQSNSIVLAPYIVISERADADEILEIVHDALVGEARRAGFTWSGG